MDSEKTYIPNPDIALRRFAVDTIMEIRRSGLPVLEALHDLIDDAGKLSRFLLGMPATPARDESADPKPINAGETRITAEELGAALADEVFPDEPDETGGPDPIPMRRKPGRPKGVGLAVKPPKSKGKLKGKRGKQRRNGRNADDPVLAASEAEVSTANGGAHAPLNDPVIDDPGHADRGFSDAA